jgi:hypothetical protein
MVGSRERQGIVAICPRERRPAMKEHTQNWPVGWIAATIALVAAVLIIIDIAAHRGETLGDVFGSAVLAATDKA